MPLLNDPSQADITHSLRTVVASHLEKASPSAILLITAHWEEQQTKVSSGPTPDLYYDYYGFPPEAYTFKYPAPGSPTLAHQIITLLQHHGIHATADTTRGWDHGVFVPMLLARPQADIPIIQMSVLASQSPTELFALGQALSSLRDQNIAIIGSGSASFHSFRNFGKATDQAFQNLHAQWSKKLDKAMRLSTAEERFAALKEWKDWEGSQMMHPPGHAEHFSPAIVCAGAAGDLLDEEGDSGDGSDGNRGVDAWTDRMMGFAMQNWIWRTA